MADGDIKTGSELIEISGKVLDIKSQVDEVLSTYTQVTSNLLSKYEGKNKENLEYLNVSINTHLMNLSQVYDKIGIYINYVFEQMKFTDEELDKMIEESMTNGGGY